MFEAVRPFIDKLLKSELIVKSGISFVFKILGFTVNYIFLLLGTHYFGAEGWGEFAICYSILQSVSLLGTLGIDIVSTKLVALRKLDIVNLYKKSVLVIIPLNLALTSILYINADFVSQWFAEGSNHLAPHIKVVSMGLLPVSLLQLHVGIFGGLKNMVLFSVFANLGRFGGGVVIVAIGVLFEQQADILVMGYIASCFILFIISLVPTLKALYKNNINQTEQIGIQELLGLGFSLFRVSFTNQGINWSSTLVAAFFLPNHLVGIYDTCFRLSAITGMILLAVNSISGPKFAEAQENIALLKRNVYESTRLIFITNVPVIITLMILAPYVISIFGDTFAETGTIVLRALLVGRLIGCLVGPVGTLMQMTGMQNAYGNILSIGLVLGIISQYLSIELYGILSVAVVNAGILAFTNIVSSLYLYKKRQIVTLYVPFRAFKPT